MRGEESPQSSGVKALGGGGYGSGRRLRGQRPEQKQSGKWKGSLVTQKSRGRGAFQLWQRLLGGQGGLEPIWRQCVSHNPS